MRVDCLMGTYGRYDLACEALACFLEQTVTDDVTLLVYNQHPVPMHFDHPRVRVVNEVGPPVSLRHIRARMHELADPAADFLHWWDDDDLYLPWHLQDCLANIGEAVAWKPRSVWFSRSNVTFVRGSYTCEGSWMFRAGYLRGAPLDTHPEYTDHPVVPQSLEASLVEVTDLGDRTSYIYRDTGSQHLSAYGTGSDQQQAENIALWRNRSVDVRPGGWLVPADLTERWAQYLEGTRGLVSAESWERNRLSTLG